MPFKFLLLTALFTSTAQSSERTQMDQVISLALQADIKSGLVQLRAVPKLPPSEEKLRKAFFRRFDHSFRPEIPEGADSFVASVIKEFQQ